MNSSPDLPRPVAHPPACFTAFRDATLVATGALEPVALAAARALRDRPGVTVLVFDDRDGSVVELDARGDDAAVLAHVRQHYGQAPDAEPRDPPDIPAALAGEPDPHGETSPRGRGRPRLGVVPREVTLLPRHWDWLSSQPGGASVALRKLVEAARHDHAERDRRRRRHERAYRVMSTLSGLLPGFDEAARALFADDAPAFRSQAAGWPPDLLAYLLQLGFDAGSVPAPVARHGG